MDEATDLSIKAYRHVEVVDLDPENEQRSINQCRTKLVNRLSKYIKHEVIDGKVYAAIYLPYIHIPWYKRIFRRKK